MIKSRWDIAQEAELKIITTLTREGLKPWHSFCLTKINLSFNASDSILDVCSGPISMLEFSPPCYKKIAIDALAKDYIRKYEHSKEVTYIPMLAEFLDFADCSFDKVFCFNAIDHCIDYEKVLRELLRVTKRGGKIILSFENMNYMYKLFYGLGFKKLCGIYHPSEISYADVKRTVRRIDKKCKYSFMVLFEKITIKNIFKHFNKNIEECKPITAQYTLPVVDRAVHYFILTWNRLFSIPFKKNHAYFVIMIITK